MAFALRLMMAVQTVNDVSSMYLFILAPQPGLEPGTYGLTENSVVKKSLFNAAYKTINLNVQ